jgi:peptidoglycan hydrolase CwlO-like protein
MGENDDATNSNNNELQIIMEDESMTPSSLTLAAEATGEVEELQEVKATESKTSPSSSSSSSKLSLTPGILAGVSFGTVALGGLVTARSMLSQRQKKLDEEKMTLEEQQKRLETEATKLQKEKSQNKNLLLVRTM